jgi:host factor-I protein
MNWTGWLEIFFNLPQYPLAQPVNLYYCSAFLLKNKNSVRTQFMAEKQQNIQDVFLNKIRKEKNSVTVFLVNGVKLQGIVTWFDNFSLLLKRDSHIQLVYKHAISTIMPSGALSLYDGDEEDDVVSSESAPSSPSE